MTVTGVFSVFLQHSMYQTCMCVLQIHCTQLVSSMKKRQTTVKFRYPVFTCLPSLHYYGGLAAFAHLLRSGNPAPPRNHSTCSTSNPFRHSDYMTTPINYCYICLRPPSKWFWTILHATSLLPARWTPLVERKSDFKESGIVRGPHL